MVAAQEQALGIFADAVLKLALHIQQQAMEAEDLDQKVRAAGAVHRLGRGLRQTVALQARLARDARAEAAKSAPPRPAPDEWAEEDEPDEPDDPKAVAVRRRRDWLTRGVERCVWNEYDRADETEEFTGESLLEDLYERLSDLMADPDSFLELDPDDLLVELAKELGLKPPEFHPRAPPVPAPPSQAGAINGHDSS
ncbi:hypothetical protein [Phenylobacterium sp.]|uniref:hypothetical protein n=1 Tax=Phenylobacterium sp. TaxID=1871053 RepID=UPI002BDF8855|nr:hypothetical protein [Phenylobacterium sp.]HLZ76444.1 hypothetical protein [Phenylobacterium sp.]